MSALYARLETTARRLLSAYGYSATLVRAGAATGPSHAPAPTTPQAIGCFVVETSAQFGTLRTEGTVQDGDVFGLMSTELTPTAVPTLADKLVLGGYSYSFVKLEPLRPGGQTLLYQFHIRR